MERGINTKTLKIGVGVVLVIAVLLGLQFLATNKKTEVEGIDTAESILTQDIKADKIQVVHFHATQQCWSCIVLGEYAHNTLKNRFPDELGSGKIEFLEVNIDLPENSDITEKFKASGSSLFVNVIQDNQDHISEEVQVWRLLGSEVEFRKYLGDKLEEYL